MTRTEPLWKSKISIFPFETVCTDKRRSHLNMKDAHILNKKLLMSNHSGSIFPLLSCLLLDQVLSSKMYIQNLPVINTDVICDVSVKFSLDQLLAVSVTPV